MPPICEEFKTCYQYPQWQCPCGQSNWRSRVACCVCQRPHPEGDAHTAALREELEDQARLKDIKDREQGDKQPKPGSRAYAAYLEKTAKMLQELVKMCGEGPAAVLREKYTKEKAEHEAARPLDERVTLARRGLDKIEAKLEASKKRHAQYEEEQRTAAEKRDAEAAAIVEQEAEACKARKELQAVKAEVEREGTEPPQDWGSRARGGWHGRWRCWCGPCSGCRCAERLGEERQAAQRIARSQPRGGPSLGRPSGAGDPQPRALHEGGGRRAAPWTRRPNGRTRRGSGQLVGQQCRVQADMGRHAAGRE